MAASVSPPSLSTTSVRRSGPNRVRRLSRRETSNSRVAMATKESTWCGMMTRPAMRTSGRITSHGRSQGHWPSAGSGPKTRTVSPLTHDHSNHKAMIAAVTRASELADRRHIDIPTPRATLVVTPGRRPFRVRSTASNAALPPVSAKVVPTPEADRGVPVDARRVREGLVREVSYLQKSSGALQTCQGLLHVVLRGHDLSVGAGRSDHASQPSTLATAEALASEAAGGDESGQRGEVTAVAASHRIADSRSRLSCSPFVRRYRPAGGRR